MSDLVPLAWWQRLALRRRSAAAEASLLAAAAMVRRGVPTVTVIVPRAPGVVVSARAYAEQSGVQVRADQIGTATVTLKFFPTVALERHPSDVARDGAWRWLPGWAGRIRRAARP